MTADPDGLAPSDALIDGAYRYVLTRELDIQLGAGPKVMCWVCLNPSTADARRNDNSVRRMLGFAKREACSAMWIVNTHGLRSRTPRLLLPGAHPDPVGPRNDHYLVDRARRADVVVAGWGALHPKLRERGTQVRAMLAAAGVELLCLGTTASGDPRHPLYVKADTPLSPLTSHPASRALW